MAPKRKAKGGGGAKKKGKAAAAESKSSSKKKVSSESSSSSLEVPLTFKRYASVDGGDEIGMDGLAKLAEDLGIDAATDTKLLAFCWRLQAEKPGVISEAEWQRVTSCPRLPTYGSSSPTVEALKEGWDQLDPGFLDNAEFRPFYKFCFEFNREGTKKFLDKDAAIALLPLCVENRSTHTKQFVAFLEKKSDDFKLNKDQWCSFLDFSLSVGPGPAFDGWDADESSWPILLDEFVEYAKAQAKEDTTTTTTTTKQADDDQAQNNKKKKTTSTPKKTTSPKDSKKKKSNK